MIKCLIQPAFFGGVIGLLCTKAGMGLPEMLCWLVPLAIVNTTLLIIRDSE